MLWIFLRLGVLNELQYRANLAVRLLESLLNLGTALAGLGVVFSKTDTLAGWRPAELLAVIGVYLVVGGLTQTVIRPSLAKFMEDVRLGTLDFTLTKPADAQLLASIRQVEMWKLIDVMLGVGVLSVALVQLGTSVGTWQAASFAIALLAGGAIVYSFLLILATCSFWLVRIENILVIFQSMYQAGRWPIAIYPRWLRSVLTFLVPVGFAITVPAQGLVGRLSWPALLGAIVLAVVLPLASRRFWTAGVRHYSGASA